MPFDPLVPPPAPQRIAVVGGGVAGLGAAYLLSREHDVTLFEAEPRLGGHARTRIAGRNRQVAVDTGFIVFNYRNYPLLTGLFEELDVPVKKSDMAFAASFDRGRVEYGLHALSALFAQKSMLTRADYWRMLRDIPRFNRGAKALGDTGKMTLGELMEHLGVGSWFRDYFMVPLAGAVWSASADQILRFPAKTFIRFFDNHGLLTLHDQPQWFTVDGGSQVYVEKVAAAIRLNGGEIRCSAPVEAINRTGAITIKTKNQEPESFDAIVLACHSDQALGLLCDADESEQEVLGAIKYAPNRVYLHDDPAPMPIRRKCWASWNYKGNIGVQSSNITVTYWMNRLQGLPADTPLFVTLNPDEPIRDEHVFDEAVLSHPVFDQQAIDAQEKLPAIQGVRNTWFCGAYARYGFHEDGLMSAAAVAREFGSSPQWA